MLLIYVALQEKKGSNPALGKLRNKSLKLDFLKIFMNAVSSNSMLQTDELKLTKLFPPSASSFIPRPQHKI